MELFLVFNLKKYKFFILKYIIGVDLTEKKGIISELDDCKIYILYKSNNGNLVSIYNVKSTNDLVGYSLINTFI